MLIIKKDQIEKFIAEDDTQLNRVIREIVREAFHDAVAAHSDSTLDAMVRVGIDRAKSRGFERAEDIASFVALMFEISPGFDTVESINAVFGDQNMPPGMKIEQILGRVTEEVWGEAANTYDASAWFPEKGDDDR